MSEPQEPSAPVFAVRLHPNEALITRRWSGEVEATTDRRLRLPLAPDAEADQAYAQARLRTGEGLRPVEVLAVRPTGNAATEVESSEEEEPPTLELEHRQRLLEHEARLIRHFVATTWTTANPPLSDWQKLFERYRRASALLAEETKRPSQTPTGDGAQRALPPSADITLRLPGVKGVLEVDLTFRSRRAGWTPCYDLLVEPEALDESAFPSSARLLLSLIARVEQTTGEDWTNVELDLACEPPPEPRAAPALGRLFVSGFQGPPATATERPTRSPHEERTLWRPLPRFRPAAPVSIPSRAGPFRVELLQRSAQGSIAYELRMEGPQTVWRVLETTAPAQLVGAPAAVFWGSAFTGVSTVEATRAGDPVRLDLGGEPGLHVRRTDHRQPPIRSRGSNKLEHRFEREAVVRNDRLEALDLQVKARLPVSGSSDVEVELRELPPRMVVDEATGEGHTLARLSPGTERTFRQAFSVHAPRTVVVAGPEDDE